MRTVRHADRTSLVSFLNPQTANISAITGLFVPGFASEKGQAARASWPFFSRCRLWRDLGSRKIGSSSACTRRTTFSSISTPTSVITVPPSHGLVERLIGHAGARASGPHLILADPDPERKLVDFMDSYHRDRWFGAALDPLGSAMIAERLSDEILPGVRARMAEAMPPTRLPSFFPTCV